MDYTFNKDYWDVSMFNHWEFYVGTIIFALIAYLIGSINGGQILSRLGSKSLGDSGSRNYGATNAGRVYGAKGFALVFIFDMFKAVFAAMVLELIMTQGTMNPDSINPEYIFAYASIPLAMVWVIIGHSFPIYFGFTGGKGVATAFGCVIILNWIFAIIAIAVFGIVIKVTRWTSLGSVFGTLIGCILVIFAHGPFYEHASSLFFYWSNSWLEIFSASFLGLFIVVRHRNNIIRMIQGKDPFMKPKGYVAKDAK